MKAAKRPLRPSYYFATLVDEFADRYMAEVIGRSTSDNAIESLVLADLRRQFIVSFRRDLGLSRHHRQPRLNGLSRRT